ncbi:MAG: T9SS type A sorting domain-containing protein [Bacteroidetes bacterium]|nr:T9SS type A sorting domain-containing protein [Bacteroidota bacterium]
MQVYASPGFGCGAAEASKLAIVSVNNSVSPIMNVPFQVVVETRAANNIPTGVSTDVNITLSLVTGTGILGGALTGTVNAGAFSATLSGITYDTAEPGVSIRISDNASYLVADTSDLFEVLATAPEPVKLDIVSVNGGIDPQVNTDFTVVVRTLDENSNVANVQSALTITLSLATGTGIMGGTLTGTVAAGNNTTTITGVTYNTAENNVSIIAADDASLLAADTSALFNVVSGTTFLDPGDIAIVQFRTDPEDGFSFVALADIPGSTEVKFTDNGWTESSALTTSENTLVWSCPSTGISAGTVVGWQNGSGITSGFVSGTLDGLSDLGDQILIYQGTATSPEFIYALSTVPWSMSGSISGENHSYLPSPLINGATAIYFTDADNGYYKLTPVSGSADYLRTSISDTINWYTVNSSGATFVSTGYWDFTIDIQEIVTTGAQITVYPNPVHDILYIRGKGISGYIRLYNIMGELIYEIKSGKEMTKMDISALPPGVYVADVVICGEDKHVIKILKY